METLSFILKLMVDIRYDSYTMTTETMIVSNKSKVEGKSGVTIATNLACVPLVGVDWALRPFFL
jgi:hypothetical protein